jgi:hypothetical protein
MLTPAKASQTQSGIVQAAGWVICVSEIIPIFITICWSPVEKTVSGLIIIHRAIRCTGVAIALGVSSALNVHWQELIV